MISRTHTTARKCAHPLPRPTAFCRFFRVVAGAPVADVAGALRSRLRASESARRVAAVCDRSAERQSAQVDGSDVGAPERSGHLSSLSAFHHACAVGGRRGLDPLAGGRAGSHGGADPRWDELPEARLRPRSASRGSTAGRAGRSRIARRRSPSRCGRARGPGCSARRCICRRTWLTPRQRRRGEDSRHGDVRARNGNWR